MTQVQSQHRLVAYVRTYDGSTAQMQLNFIQRFAQTRKIEIIAIFEDPPGDPDTDHPQLNKAVDFAIENKATGIIVCDDPVDQGRNTFKMCFDGQTPQENVVVSTLRKAGLGFAKTHSAGKDAGITASTWYYSGANWSHRPGETPLLAKKKKRR